MALSTRFLLTACAGMSSAFSISHSSENGHKFPVLQLDRRNATGVFGNSTSNGTIAYPLTCNFTQEFTVNAVEANCSAYIEPLESSSVFLPWERWDTADRFTNCTYHQIASLLPDVPEGPLAFAFRDGRLVVIKKPNMTDARLYPPLPPLKPSVDLKGTDKSTAFLPIWEASIQPFFDAYAKSTPCQPAVINNYTHTSTFSTTDTVDTSAPTTSPEILYEAMEIATHQYTRCAIQQPSSIESCTVDTTRKRFTIPSTLFIYFGASQCDSLLWSALGVSLSILLDFLQTAALMWLKGTGPFSWLQLLVKLSAGIGEPTVQAFMLNRANMNNNSGFIIAAMEFLQPTAAPLLAGLAGWYFSKGHGFQVLATDAIVTLLGVIMMMLFTGGQVFLMLNTVTSGSGGLGPGDLLVPIGVICAVGPWLLSYLLFGFIAIPLQLGFILGILEAWLFKTGYMFGMAFFALGAFIIVFGFLGLTPIWALWELGWALRRLLNKHKYPEQQLQGKTDSQEKVGDKNLFPLARFFRDKFLTTSRFKRGLVKFVFWLFIMTSFISFVGKWMFMINVLKLAGDAYCPSGYKEATFAGLGFKAAVLSMGVVLQFFGLTA